MKKQNVEVWVELAKSDLNSARSLYNIGHYRTSYFLFQQAVEKANKAFILSNNLATDEEIKDAKHDQFKILRKTLVNQEKSVTNLINTLELFPEVKDHEVTDMLGAQKQKQFLNQGLRFIDSLRHRDLVNITTSELNYFSRQLKDIQIRKIGLSKDLDKKANKIILKIADWAGHFKTPQAIEAKKDFQAFAKDKSKQTEVYKAIMVMLEVLRDSIFAYFTIYICGLLTIQHSSKTRYPEPSFNPLKIYTSKLPIIKKQPIFMDFLEDALNRIIKLENIESYFK